MVQTLIRDGEVYQIIIWRVKSSESFEVECVCVCSGVVLDSGDGVSHSVPVFEGYCLPHAVQRFNLAGADVTLQLQKVTHTHTHTHTHQTQKSKVHKDG